MGTQTHVNTQSAKGEDSLSRKLYSIELSSLLLFKGKRCNKKNGSIYSYMDSRAGIDTQIHRIHSCKKTKKKRKKKKFCTCREEI